MKTDFQNVFICYSRCDREYAFQVYHMLRGNGYTVFLDLVTIQPGDDWEVITLKHLREANFLIVLLSEESIRQRGYAEKEYTIALSYYESRDNPRLVIFPLKIDNCTPPHELRRMQWTEFSAPGIEKILNAMNSTRNVWLQTGNGDPTSPFPPAKGNRRLFLWIMIVIGGLIGMAACWWLLPAKVKKQAGCYTAVLTEAQHQHPLSGAVAYILNKTDTLAKSNVSGSDGKIYLFLDTTSNVHLRIRFAHAGCYTRVMNVTFPSTGDTVNLQLRNDTAAAPEPK